MYLLLGYGFSNKEVFKFLKNKRKKIIIYDDNIKNNKIINSIDKINFHKIKYIIVSAGIKPKHEIIIHGLHNKIPILTDLDLLFRYKKKNDILVGLTGSNGKTTTVTLIGNLLNNFNINSWICGNIGISLFTPLHKFIKKPIIYVIEISSYQAFYMQNIKFNLGIVINITSNHEEWHEGFNNYVNSKMKLLSHSEYKILFNNFHNNWSIQDHMIYYKNQYICNIINESLLLIHNQNNLLMALKILEEIIYINNMNINFITMKHLIYKINEYKLQPFRQEIIYKNNNLTIINDSKSTNIYSMITAIQNQIYKNQKILLIIGGIIKGDLSILNKNLLNNIDYIYTFGHDYLLLLNHLHNNNYFNCKGFKKLLHINHNIDFKTYNIILFSPGGASYDEFKNYIERGKYFNYMCLTNRL